MAYLSSTFSHDIFISYCHDNDGNGWVSHFENDLKILLKDRIREADIWRDTRRLGGNTVFDKAIEEGIQKSALFIAILSDIYLDSAYCKNELQMFHEKAAREPWGLEIDNQRRIFCVLINDISHTQFPKQFEGMTGREFHDESSWPLERDDVNYKKQLKTLATEIIELLRTFEKVLPDGASSPDRIGEQAATAASTARITAKLAAHPGRPVVYLPEPSGLLRNLRNRVIADLNNETNQINIVTSSLVSGEDEVENIIQTRMQGADLTVHLLNNDPGPEIEEGIGKTYFQRQAELALGAKTHQLLWVPEALDLHKDVEDDTYREFLLRLEKENRSPNCRLVRTLPNALTRTILGHLEEIQKAQESPLLPAISGALLNTQTRSDQVQALDVYEALMARRVNAYLEREPKRPEEFILHLEDKLKMVNCLIVVYGESDENWVIARLLMVAHLARELGRPLRKFGIYFAPPRSKTVDRQFVVPFLPTDLVYQFDQNDITNPNGLNPLLA